MTVIGVILMLVVIVLAHESAHALMAKALGYRLTKVYIGIPLSIGKFNTTIKKWEKNGVEYGISWLLLGGGVDFQPEATWKHQILIAVVGPLSNFLLAFVALTIIGGPVAAWNVCLMIASLIWQGIGGVFTPEGVAALIGPVGFVSGTAAIVHGSAFNWLVMWAIINISLFITNIVPIPALDGGHVLLSVITGIFGDRFKKPATIMSYAVLYSLCVLMIFIMMKDVVLLFK